MLQAEIAGRVIPTAQGQPEKGNVLPDFELHSSQGQPLLASAYRGRSNLVLILAADLNLLNDLLSQFESKQQELAENNARILVTAVGTKQHACELKQELRLNHDLLVDLDGRVPPYPGSHRYRRPTCADDGVCHRSFWRDICDLKNK